MMRFLAGILAITAAAGQPLPNLGWGSLNAGYAWYGPKNLYPGFTQYFTFPYFRWRVPVTCSATGNTCDTAGSGYTPTGSETGVQVTADVLPAGMDSQTISGAVTGLVYAQYAICNVVGTTFRLGQGSTCSTIEPFTSTGTNVSILLTNATVGATTTWCLLCNSASATGFPTGTTIKWGYFSDTVWLQDTTITANGNIQNGSHANQLIAKVTIPTSATPGDYPITFVNCTADSAGGVCGGRSDRLTFTVTVAPLTVLSDAAGPTSFPAITGMSTWVTYMTDNANGGGKWCNPATGELKNPANIGGLPTQVIMSPFTTVASTSTESEHISITVFLFAPLTFSSKPRLVTRTRAILESSSRISEHSRATTSFPRAFR